MQEEARRAVEFGFSHAAPLAVATFELRPEVREMCAADKCNMYGKTWVCPPGCGSLEANAARLAGYARGILVQTTGRLEDDFDYETMQATGEKQKQLFKAFLNDFKLRHPDTLALGSGGCTQCERCTYPGAPCRRPGDATPSMEAFGLWVSDVCAKNGLPYNYGPKTITYTGCYLVP